jgi:hypothetical protein
MAGMAGSKSRSGKIVHWAADHTAWDLVKEEGSTLLRPLLGSGVITGGMSYGLNHLGVVGPWLIVVTLVIFGVVILIWDVVQKRKTYHPGTPATSPSPKEYSNPPFHPGQAGRRIEAAVFGSPRYEPTNVAARIEALRKGERLPVNHFELGIADPDKGNDEKFLTVTLSETLRQGDELVAIHEWLSANSASAKNAPLLMVTHEYDGGYESLVFTHDKPNTEVRNITFEWLSSTKLQPISVIDQLRPVQAGNFERCRVHGFDMVTASACPLKDLIKPENRTEDSVTVKYDDDKRNRFQRKFVLTRRGNLVEWKPEGPPTLRDS